MCVFQRNVMVLLIPILFAIIPYDHVCVSKKYNDFTNTYIICYNTT